MAKSSFELNWSNSSGSHLEGLIEWESRVTGDNSSDVTASIYVRKKDTTQQLTISTYGTWTFKLGIAGKEISGSKTVSVLEDWVLLGTTTVSGIKHNDDGSKSITISGSVTGPYSSSSYSSKTTSGSSTVELDKIARASKITSVGDVTLGSACDVKWTPMAASFRYRLKFTCGGWSKTTDAIHPNTTSAYPYTGYTFPLEVANEIPTKSGKMTVTLYTYSDSNATVQVGDADTKEFTVTVPENEDTRPKVSMTLAPDSTPFEGLYIQGKSKLQADLVIEPKFGATIVESSFTVDGTPYDEGYLTKTGELSVKASVKDSRGHPGTAFQTITVIPYSKPIVQAASWESNIVAARCDKDGNPTNSGTYLKIKAKLIYEKVVSEGVQKNFGKLQYSYRAEGGLWSDWYTILDSKATTATEVTTGALLNGALSVETNYQVQVRAVDDIEESLPVTLSVPSEAVYMDRPAGGKGMGLGGYNSGANSLDIYWKTKARGGISLFEAGKELNLGSILPLPRGELSAGWNPNSLSNGIHVVEDSAYPLKDPMGNVLMENGVLIQMAATPNGSVRIQVAFPTDSNTPVYRLYFYTNWTDWNSFKI